MLNLHVDAACLHNSYSLCDWGVADPWLWGPEVGNSWRTDNDIQPMWSDILRSIDNTAGLARFAGPGGWNDPDMLEVRLRVIRSCTCQAALHNNLAAIHNSRPGTMHYRRTPSAILSIPSAIPKIPSHTQSTLPAEQEFIRSSIACKTVCYKHCCALDVGVGGLRLTMAQSLHLTSPRRHE